MLTPHYASPEQMRGEAITVAVGCLLARRAAVRAADRHACRTTPKRTSPARWRRRCSKASRRRPAAGRGDKATAPGAARRGRCDPRQGAEARARAALRHGRRVGRRHRAPSRPATGCWRSPTASAIACARRCGGIGSALPRRQRCCCGAARRRRLGGPGAPRQRGGRAGARRQGLRGRRLQGQLARQTRRTTSCGNCPRSCCSSAARA